MNVKPVAVAGVLTANLFGCGLETSPKVEGAKEGVAQVSQALSASSDLSSSCGYSLKSGTYTTWPGGYQAWVELRNVEGAVGLDFEVLVDVGDTQIVNGYQAEYAVVEGGYAVTAPSWLQYQKIKVGGSYRFAFVGSGQFQGLTAYVLSINGQACDTTPPVVDSSVDKSLVTAAGVLQLTAEASDDVDVRKVVFYQDGVEIAQDWDAPYAVDVAVTEALNGRHTYTATAVDPSGNEASDSESVLVAIDNRFVGTAPDVAADYVDILEHFDQITPENAGKWGVVESTRDVMTWTELDAAFAFAEENDLPIKLHTLIWGQQEPSWLASLPAEEQLAEIHEWFGALAERYGDIPLIDVVNEPINAPASTVAALGGAGTTGWDWVITAFELAREYFPNSELLLNEYQILMLDQFTTNYLQLVTLLQERGLIDGIGVQAHFLERAELPVVEANLTRLTDTGLPVYISELDVNFADDARHANRFAALYEIFLANPSVLGITNWGHLQGSTWQPHTYLVRNDGTSRPALDWLDCTLSGASTCPLPEYVPAPRTGDLFGLTIEGEDYDDSEGVLALGDVVAYTDVGDWTAYYKVNFQETWDTLWVTYAKGSADVGGISIYLDDLSGAPVLSIPLPPTAGWGSFETIEVPWAPLLGERDVYVTFDDVYGVGNIDNIRFGRPGGNLLDNGTFENGISGWGGWGTGTRSATNTLAHGGQQSLLIGGRGDATAATEISAKVLPGETYDVSAWVSVGGTTAQRVNIAMVLNCGAGDTYPPWVAADFAVPPLDWVQLQGSFTLPADCSPTKLELYFQGDPDYDIYVDDVVVAGAMVELPNLVQNPDFEVDASGWYGWGSGTRSVSSARAHGGTQSLLVSNRGDANAATNLSSVLQPGATYEASLWVSVSAGPANVNTARVINCGNGDEYPPWVASSNAVPDDGWVELTGTFTIPADCALSKMEFYVQADPNIDLYIDDVRVVDVTP